jgi:uncharacterized protein YjdB
VSVDAAQATAVRVRLFYQRTSDQVTLATTVLSSADSRAAALSVNVTSCEIDSQRVPLSTGCPVSAELILVRGDTQLDSTVVGPVAVREGENAQMPPATLYDVATVRILEPSDSVFRFEPETTLVVSATASDRTGAEVLGDTASWKAGTPSVATIGASTGALTTIGPGTTTITVTIGGRTASATVEVTPFTARRVVVVAPTTTLAPGASVPFAVNYFDRKGRPLLGRTVSWASSNSAIASVSSSGAVTGVASGTARISATVDSASNGVDVTVAPTSAANVASVAVSVDRESLVVGQTAQATATAMDAQGHVLTGRTVSAWRSSNSAVASVSASGVVTALAAGAVTISAAIETIIGTSPNVTVNAAGPGSVTVTLPSTMLTVGQAVQGTAVVRDASGIIVTNPAIVWATSNPAVATVSTSGVVTATSAGTATITATASGASGGVGITVVPIPVTTVAVSLANANLVVGQTTQATATPKDAQGNVLSGRAAPSWTSSNTAVATVSASGLVTAVSPGSANVSASIDGVASAPVAVTVQPRPVTAVSVALSRSTIVNGQALTAIATAFDQTGTVLPGRPVSAWQSSNSAVAVVSPTGFVTTFAPGTVTISATIEGIAGTSQPLTVTDSLGAVTIVLSPSTLSAGQTVQAVAVVHANVIRTPTFIWTTSNAAVATVSASGLVTALAPGTATISATFDGQAGFATLTVR